MTLKRFIQRTALAIRKANERRRERIWGKAEAAAYDKAEEDVGLMVFGCKVYISHKGVPLIPIDRLPRDIILEIEDIRDTARLFALRDISSKLYGI